MQLVEATYEEQVGHLFDDGKRVGKSACPKGFPHFIDLRFEFSGDHRSDENKGQSTYTRALSVFAYEQLTDESTMQA
jgi:hypothetical protein